MTIFFTTTLVISVVGMVVLLVLKQWELSTGHVIGGRVRPALGAAMHRALVWVEYMLPMLVRDKWDHTKRYSRTLLHRLAALGVLLVERLLERLLKLLRRTTTVPRNDSQASAFLREVSAHKKQLLKSARKRETYEE